MPSCVRILHVVSIMII